LLRAAKSVRLEASMFRQLFISDDPNLYLRIGHALGSIAGLVTFFSVYVAAIDSVGWVIGIALGWIAAVLASTVANRIAKYLWGPILFLIAVLVVPPIHN
jgi:hypothetical protein